MASTKRAAAAGSAPHLWLGARRARPLGPLVLDRHARAPRNGVLNSAHGRRQQPAGRPQQVPGRAMRGRCTCGCVWMACRMYTPNGSLAPTDTSFDLSMPAAWHVARALRNAMHPRCSIGLIDRPNPHIPGKESARQKKTPSAVTLIVRHRNTGRRARHVDSHSDDDTGGLSGRPPLRVGLFHGTKDPAKSPHV